MRNEEAIVFDCKGDRLVGILHHPTVTPKQGILMVVGGPQYRVGSHRQFVEFARAQCERGNVVMRFDYRGMGDSEGPFLKFEQVQEDIVCAMNEFFRRVPSLERVFWFGLCDGAAASLIHVPDDPRINGMMLLNPWVRNSQTQAQAVVKHYYRQRLLGKEFWRKLFTGKANILESLGSFFSNLKQSRAKTETSTEDFRSRMLKGAQNFKPPVLLILSGNDLTANEFQELTKQSSEWTEATHAPNWTWQSVPDANHTFSNSKAKQEVIDLCSNWINSK